MKAAKIIAAVIGMMLASCAPEVKYVDKKTPSGGEGGAPELSALYFEYADGSVASGIKLRNPQTDVEMEFKAVVTSYKVVLPNPAPEVKLIAKASSGFSVKYVTGNTIFRPVGGGYSVVNAVDAEGRSTTYTVYYAQEAGADAPEAKLVSALLSSGPQIMVLDGLFQSSDGCAASEEGKRVTVTLPYGVTQVSVFAVGEAGSYIAYGARMPLTLSGTPAGGGITVTVLNEGKNAGNYTIDFNVAAAGQVSVLKDVIVSPGWFAAEGMPESPLAFNPAAASAVNQFIYVPKQTLTGMISATGKAAVALVAVKPDGKPFTTVKYMTGSAEFSGVLEDTNADRLNEVQVTITVNNGEGYMDRQYMFRVKTVEGESASSDANASIELTSGTGAVLKRRGADGVSGAVGFTAGVTAYNLEFSAATTSVTLKAMPPDNGAVAISGVGSVADVMPVGSKALTVTPLSARSGPIQVMFTKAGKLPAVYTVFFVNMSKQPARLAVGLAFAGGCAIEPVFTPSDYKTELQPYTVNVPSNVTALIAASLAPANPNLSVNYAALNNPSNGEEFAISVGDGDADYITGVYHFKVNRLAALNAALNSLSATAEDTNYLGGFVGTTYVYNVTIPATVTGTDVIIGWTYEAANIESVKYAVENGDWSAHDEDGFTLTGLTVGASKVVRVKVRTKDGAEGVYALTLYHAAPAANLDNMLSGLQLDGDNTGVFVPVEGFTPATYYYALSPAAQTAKLKPILPIIQHSTFFLQCGIIPAGIEKPQIPKLFFERGLPCRATVNGRLSNTQKAPLTQNAAKCSPS